MVAEKKWFWVINFKSLGRGECAELSKVQGRAKLLEWATFLRTFFFFFANVLFLYISIHYHYVYSNIFDIAESLTENDHDPI